VALNKIADLSALWEAVSPYGGVVRVIVDHPDQIRFLENFEKQQVNPKKWSAFIKIDNGNKCVFSPNFGLMEQLMKEATTDDPESHQLHPASKIL
jgi:hypothetical protein